MLGLKGQSLTGGPDFAEDMNQFNMYDFTITSIMIATNQIKYYNLIE